jgi:hypothetical protein
MTRIPNISAGHALRALALACLTSILVLSQGIAWAQSGDTGSSSSGSTTSSGTSAPAASGGDTATSSDTGPKVVEGTAPEARIPPATSLDTGQPLWSSISPLRWSHLSLLSASFVNIYDTNYNLGQNSASSSNVQMFQATAAFSIHHNRSALDVQWQPSFWYANSTFNHNLTGNLLDLQTSYAFSAKTTLTATDRFSYIPGLSPLSQGGLSANYSNLLLLLNPFLAQGTKELINNFGVTVDHVIDGQNHLTFNAAQDFVRLSSPPVTPKPQIICLPGLPFCFIEPGPPPKAALLQVRPSINAGVTWSHQPDARNTYKLIYNVDREFLRGTFENDTLYHHIGFGYNRMMTERTSIALEAGPTFSQSRSLPDEIVRNHIAATGSATLFHTFSNGGFAISAERSYNFSGLFSDSANTRVDFTITRSLTRKWQLAGGASYIRQEFSFASPAHGTTENVRVSYPLKRSISVFASYYYLRTGGSTQPTAPRSSVSGGISWSWVPETNNY